MTPEKRVKLLKLLREVESRYHRKEFLALDPLEFVHRFDDPRDQEVVALVSAFLAYGNVLQIRRSVSNCLDRIQSSGLPIHRWVDAGDREVLNGFRHRFTSEVGMKYLFDLIAQSRKSWGSVGAHFCSYVQAEDQTIEAALVRFVADWKKNLPPTPAREIKFLISSPELGSSCKRWCMLLRWMGRKDQLDPGLWMKGSRLLQKSQNGISPSQLLIPLDTHLIRAARALRLTRRKVMDWRAVLEVTTALRELDSEDPVRFDFALCRAGMKKEKLLK